MLNPRAVVPGEKMQYFASRAEMPGNWSKFGHSVSETQNVASLQPPPNFVMITPLTIIRRLNIFVTDKNRINS